jgi:hypothetical protein
MYIVFGLACFRCKHNIHYSRKIGSALHLEMSQITAGRICLTLNALVTVIGPFAADWSDTHLFNPKWTPHAKFHDGHTMSMGALLGLATLYYTWQSDSASRRESIETAAIFSSLYYISGISAVFYPGALGCRS